MTGRAGFRWGVLATVVLLAAALTGSFVIRSLRDQQQKQVPTAETAKDRALPLGSVLDAPHVVFRSASPGPTFGHLAAVPLADPNGKRSVSELVCDRVYATRDGGDCMSTVGSGLVKYRNTDLDAQMTPGRQMALGGAPSRTRISADSTLQSTTVFVTGHSYASMAFSTETVIVNRMTGQNYGNLETSFTPQIDPRRNRSPDLNIWGVTFPREPNPTWFYATVAAGGETWLARGDLVARTLTAVRPDAECPSLSPDGRTVVYKKRAGSPIRWRYHALDLASGREWALPETRSVDDQVEWLDDAHVLYGVPRDNSTSDYDVWVTDIRKGKPSVFIRNASSPAVVR